MSRDYSTMHTRVQLAARSIFGRVLNSLRVSAIFTALLTMSLAPLFTDTVSATTAGPRSPVTGADNAGTGTTTWSTPANVVSQNGTSTTNAVTSAGFSHYLVASNYGFTIPTNATINGV